MKKGFTLIELLAIIVILGILSILIVPKVIDSLNNSEEKTNLTSAENLLNVAIYKSTNNDIQGSNRTVLIDYMTGENVDYLDYSGKKPEVGKIRINDNGKIEMAIKIGDYCYKKNIIQTDITVIPYNENTCVISASIPDIVTSGDGLYNSEVEPGRLIFRGANPNNYIWLDENGDNDKTTEEIYRIVSYETDGTIKVVRNQSLGSNGYKWDSTNSRTGEENSYCSSPIDGCNVWGTQYNTLFRGNSMGDNFHFSYYLDSTTQELTNSTNSGTVKTNSSLNTRLNNVWLEGLGISQYIDSHDFNVGGVYYSKTYRGGDKGIQREREEEKLFTWNGKVGLLSLTEFVESSTNSNCKSVYSNYYDAVDSNENNLSDNLPKGVWPCTLNNYNYDVSYYNQWTISPRSNFVSEVWTMTPTGSFGFSVPMNASAISNVGTTSVRPAFYLKATIQLVGTGTETDPYKILEMLNEE